MVAVNVRGVFSAVQAAAPHLGQGGRIITIGSVSADRVPQPGIGVYALTKAAVAGLTRGLARELGPRGITVNTVQIGPTDTDMNPDSGPVAEWAKQLTTVGHYGQPADIASAVAYLASPEARFVTGSQLERRRRLLCLTAHPGRLRFTWTSRCSRSAKVPDRRRPLRDRKHRTPAKASHATGLQPHRRAGRHPPIAKDVPPP